MHPLLPTPPSTPSLAALLVCSTWPHLTCSPFWSFSLTWRSPYLFPLTWPLLPVSRTIHVFIFILIEEAEALQSMFHSDTQAGGPAASQALSLLGLWRELVPRPTAGLPSPARLARLTMSRLSSRVTSCSRPCSSGNWPR